MLRREGLKDNHKRIYRIYCEQGLNLRIKRHCQNRLAAHRLERIEVNRVNQIWIIDIVADQLFNRNQFRLLFIVDNFTKKSPGLFVERQIKGVDVVAFLKMVIQREGAILGRIQGQ